MRTHTEKCKAFYQDRVPTLPYGPLKFAIWICKLATLTGIGFVPAILLGPDELAITILIMLGILLATIGLVEGTSVPENQRDQDSRFALDPKNVRFHLVVLAILAIPGALVWFLGNPDLQVAALIIPPILGGAISFFEISMIIE